MFIRLLWRRPRLLQFYWFMVATSLGGARILASWSQKPCISRARGMWCSTWTTDSMEALGWWSLRQSGMPCTMPRPPCVSSWTTASLLGWTLCGLLRGVNLRVELQPSAWILFLLVLLFIFPFYINHYYLGNFGKFFLFFPGVWNANPRNSISSEGSSGSPGLASNVSAAVSLSGTMWPFLVAAPSNQVHRVTPWFNVHSKGDDIVFPFLAAPRRETEGWRYSQWPFKDTKKLF